jgi:hypothetical protein
MMLQVQQQQHEAIVANSSDSRSSGLMRWCCSCGSSIGRVNQPAEAAAAVNHELVPQQHWTSSSTSRTQQQQRVGAAGAAATLDVCV